MRTIGLYPLCLALLVGCGGSPGDDGNNNGASTTNDAGGSETTPWFEDTGPSSRPSDGGPATDTATSPGCSEGADDPLDDDGIDSNCDGADGKVGRDVYVSPTGLDSNDGSPTTPKLTIAGALAKTRVTGGSVVLSTGEYELASLEEPGKWRIVGGYDSTFVGKNNRDRVTLVAPHSGLHITGTGVDGMLQHLRVVGASVEPDGHATAYALRVKVDRLALDDVHIESGSGRDGASGTSVGIESGADGLPGRPASSSDNPPSLTCNTVLQPTWSWGQDGDNAVGGKRGSPPVAGAPGPAGVPGTDGDNGPKAPVLVDGLLRWNDGKPGLPDARPGYGGAGAARSTTSGSASGGTGGCPGSPGNAGKSGGGSVAIMLLGGELKITRSLLKTGIAGNGGSGTAGGDGGKGGRGGYALGATGPCESTDCSGFGGAGGDGGKGAHGGGGAGGWTIGVVKVGTAKTEIDSATLFTLGSPGAGGLGRGGGYAPNGDRVREHAIP